MTGFDLEATQYGFRWGPMEVTRLISDPKHGVVLEVKGVNGPSIEVHVSMKGRSVTAYTRDGKRLKGRKS